MALRCGSPHDAYSIRVSKFNLSRDISPPFDILSVLGSCKNLSTDEYQMLLIPMSRVSYLGTTRVLASVHLLPLLRLTNPAGSWRICDLMSGTCCPAHLHYCTVVDPATRSGRGDFGTPGPSR